MKLMAAYAPTERSTGSEATPELTATIRVLRSDQIGGDCHQHHRCERGHHGNHDDASVQNVQNVLWTTLPWPLRPVAQALLDRANRKRGRLSGVRYAARIAGIRRAVLSGAVGNSALGHRLLACRGGCAMKLHGPHIRKAN